MSRTITGIEQFVTHRMWDESEGVPELKFDWKELQDKWEQGDVDWDTFQREYGLSDDTIDVLKDLASEREIKLDELKEDVATEMLSVDPLRNVVTLSI
jgi:hypothetical protein